MPISVESNTLCRRLAMYTDGGVRLLIRTTSGEDIYGYLTECGDDFITLYRDPDRKFLECFICASQVVTVRLLQDKD
ncbi:MAG: hypothetical protein ABI743_11625 [bacterium]